MRRWRHTQKAIILVMMMLFSISFSQTTIYGDPQNDTTTGFPSGWSEDVLLSPFRGTFPSIAMAGNNVHILYDNGSNGEIYYARSSNKGMSWDKNGLFTPDDIYPSGAPDLTVSDDTNVHVVWQDIRLQPPKREIFYQRSTDNGESWEPEFNLSLDDNEYSQNPTIAVSNSNVHVVWGDDRGSQYNVYYKRSIDGGITWDDGLGNVGQDRQLSFEIDPRSGGSPQIAVDKNGIIHVVWVTYSINFRWETMYIRSLDNGASWSSPVMLTTLDALNSAAWSIAVNDTGGVHVVWQEGKYGNYEIGYRNSFDYGVSWNPETRLTFDVNMSDQPTVSVNGSHVFIVWIDDRDHYDWIGPISGAHELYYIESFDGGGTWGPETRLTYAVNNSLLPVIAMDADYIHVAWTDNQTNGSREQIFYKRFPDFPADPEYNISLQEGWNLVSLPFEQSDESIDQVLSSITGKWDCIQIYNPLSSEPWKTNNTFRPEQLNDFSTLNHKMAFWINITEPGVNLTVSGYIPTSTTIPLYAGWNLVGYPTLNDTETVANALWGTGADKVEVFDPGEPYRC